MTIDIGHSPTLARHVGNANREIRTLAEVEVVLAADPHADVAALVSRVLRFEHARRGRSATAIAAFELLARLLEDARRGAGLTRIFAVVSRHDREFRRIWIALRVACPACGVGHLRILRRKYASGRVFRFAACSSYHSSGCDFTESSHQYVARKGVSVLSALDQERET